MTSNFSVVNDLLREVSRSFYLTVRILPGPIRPQIGLAYLLARLSDTIADTELVPAQQRLTALQQLHQQIISGQRANLDLKKLKQHQASESEQRLLERNDELLETLSRCCSPADQQRIRRVLAIIISGQELDLTRFGNASAESVVALPTPAELDDYTYRVAGSVGGFWTKMCRAHLFPDLKVDDVAFMTDATRFGKGLQLVNILRDLAADLRRGRCYLPAEELQQYQLAPKDLLEPKTMETLRPLYEQYLNRAEQHLRAGWRYTVTLPRSQVRLRLGCAWPILIGLQTLRKLRAGNPLDPSRRIKISRPQLRRIIVRTVFYYPSRRAWESLGNGVAKPNDTGHVGAQQDKESVN